MIHHRAEHIFSDLARTLNRLHAPASEQQTGAEVQTEPQPMSAVPPVATVPSAPKAVVAPPTAPPVVAVQPVPEAVAVPKVTEPKCPEQIPVTPTSSAAGLSYIAALQTIRGGGHICRQGWTEGICVFIEDGERIMKCTEGEHLPSKVVVDKFTPMVSDVLANDWRVLPQPNCTFFEAFVALEQGQCVRRASWTANIQIKEGKFCALDNSQQEYAMRYEDVCTPDWEIMYNSTR